LDAYRTEDDAEGLGDSYGMFFCLILLIYKAIADHSQISLT